MLIFSFLAGVFLALIAARFFGQSFFLKNNKVTKKKMADNIIAPYYRKSSFVKPKDVIVNATSGATIKIPIIMYHYVENVKDVNDLIKKRLDTNPALFEEEIKTLKNAGYHTYFIKDIPAILEKKVSYATPAAVLTFDDGYQDFYTVVFPILKKYQIKATVYLITNFINRSGFLTDDQVKEIIKSNLVEIGSHTLNHLYLKYLPEAIARKQILESKKNLEERYKIQVDTFAYPYGAFSQKTIDLVKEAGYKAAVSVIPSVFQTQDKLFYLGRLRSGFFTPKTMLKEIEKFNR